MDRELGFRLLQILVLIFLLTFLLFLWITEIFLALLGQNAKKITGNALATGTIVNWWARMSLELTGKFKMLIGRYLKNYHPGTYRKIRNLLLPRNLGRRR